MRIHILGICGTFMSGVAMLAKQAGHDVTGSDLNVYPPMSTQLAEQGIALQEGYDAHDLLDQADCVIIGNVMKRGNPAIEYVLAKRIPYTSGPAWLAEHVLKGRTVLAIAGTHGKTTTSSLLAWVLDYAGLQPGFLIGGVPENFHLSARLGSTPYFVIEADEYDSAFFDKRSKFLHYHPDILIMNNLEYDHADIFPDLEAIKQQFHYLVRTVPGNGALICNAHDLNLQEVLQKGCWTPVEHFGHPSGATPTSEWQALLQVADGSQFKVCYRGEVVGVVEWSLIGNHNVDNALAVIAAAHRVGVTPEKAIAALSQFKNVKRRLELKGEAKQIFVYDDFAHHPTAIATTLAGLRAKVGAARIIAVLELGSYTMRTGVHKEALQHALMQADYVVCKETETDWGLAELLATFTQPTALFADVDPLVATLAPQLKPGDQVIVMSNTGFQGIHQKLLSAIENG